MSHQHSISGRLIGWFSNSSPPFINKHIFSEFYSGTTWGMYELVPFSTKGNRFSLGSVFAELELKRFALTYTPPSVPVRAVPARPHISAALWNDKRGLAGPCTSHLSLPLSPLPATWEGCRAERLEWLLGPVLCGQAKYHARAGGCDGPCVQPG